MRSFVFGLCLFSLVTPTYAKKLDFYLCPSAGIAQTCGSSCEAIKGRKIEFKVNLDSAVVMSVLYEDGELFSVRALENCRVVDEDNWICKKPRFDEWMVNGIYVQLYAPDTGEVLGSCAK